MSTKNTITSVSVLLAIGLLACGPDRIASRNSDQFDAQRSTKIDSSVDKSSSTNIDSTVDKNSTTNIDSTVDKSSTTNIDSTVDKTSTAVDAKNDTSIILGGHENAAVTIRLIEQSSGGSTVSFGVPVPPGALKDPGTVRVSIGGTPVAAQVRVLFSHYDNNAVATSIAAILLQFPASALSSATEALVDITWQGTTGVAPGTIMVPFAEASAASPETVQIADRSIAKNGSTYSLVESNVQTRTLFPAREPRYRAEFPDGYLAKTGILNPYLRSASQVSTSLAGLNFMTKNALAFGRSAIYEDGYPITPEAVVDPLVEFEGWLYDRCATLLVFYAHTNEVTFLRHAYRACSYYADHVELNGTNRGTFTGKPDPDIKYSHLRGLFAYYALTGDETALAAGTAVADIWNDDPLFVGPYANGHMRGNDKLWTERLLGTSMEGLYYGHRLTGQAKYLSRFKQVLDTAYKHITTASQTDLNAITMLGGADYPAFPPQNCFIHNALQHSEGNAVDPWCSGWMTELLVDALLQWREQSGDTRVDEVFIRLSRFMRDVGTAYFYGNPTFGTFLAPTRCFDPNNTEDPRIITPAYGAGKYMDGQIKNSSEWDDYEHCADTTALTASAALALKRQNTYDQGGPFGPFASEGETIAALHEEFALCARYAFAQSSKPLRDPRVWKSSDLEPGYQDGDIVKQQAWLVDPAKRRIGYPVNQTSPQRKLSWWFNMSLLQFGLLEAGGIQVPSIAGGHVNPPNCP